MGLGNTFDAHIFKRSSRGERETVRLKLFNTDGTPLDLSGGGEEAPVVTDWADLALKSNLNWLTQDVAQWRRNGGVVELRGSFRKLFGNTAQTGANDFADPLPAEHWPSRDTRAGTVLSVAEGYRPIVLIYGADGHLRITPDAALTDPVVYLDGVQFVL